MNSGNSTAAVAAVARAAGLDAESIRFVGAGVASIAWEVRASTCDVIVRWMPTDGPRRCVYAVEHQLLARLTGLGLPVPQPLALRVGGVNGNWSLTARMRGEPIGTRDLPVASAHDLGSFLADLHALPARAFGPLGAVGDEVVGSQKSHDLGMQARWISADIWPFTSLPVPRRFLERLHPGLAPRVEKLAESIRAAATDRAAVLNHSDLHGEHVFIEAERLAGVIDFGGALVGSPAWDFASLALFLGWPSATTARAAYVANGGAAVSAEEVALLAVAFATYRLRVEYRLGNGPTVGPRILYFLLEALDRLEGTNPIKGERG